MKTTTSPALVTVLVASLAVFGLEACAPGLSCGPGTHSDGRQCQLETDAGGAQAPVDDPAILRAGDQLHAEASHQGTDLTLAPFTRVCVEVAVLHADGTRTPLRPGVGAVEIVSSVPGILTAANASECEVAGVVGLAPGATTATVRLTANGLVATAPLTVTVTSHSMEIYRYPSDPSPEGVPFGAPARGHAHAFLGSPAPLGTEWLGFSWRLLDAAMKPEILPNDVWPAERFLSLTVADPLVALAQDAPGPGDRWSLTGLSPGQTTITLAFTRPGAAATRIDAPLHVTAFDPAGLTPSSLGVMFAAPDGTPFLGGGGDFQPALSLPRGCVVPTLLGFATSGGYAAILGEGIAWTTTTRGTATAAPGSSPTEICTEPNGVVTVRGCLLASGACGERELSVIDPTALSSASLAVHNQASQPIHGTVLDFGSRYQVCVPLGAELVLASTQFDVTFQTSWSFPMPSGPGWWWPSPTRSPVDGSICFDMNQYGYLGAGTTTLIATAHFGYPRPTATIPVTLAGTLQHL